MDDTDQSSSSAEALWPNARAFLPLLPGAAQLVCVIGLGAGWYGLPGWSIEDFFRYVVVPLGMVQILWISYDVLKYVGLPFCDDLPFRVVSHALSGGVFGLVGVGIWGVVALGNYLGL